MEYDAAHARADDRQGDGCEDEDDCMHQTSTTEMKRCRNHHKMQMNETRNTYLDPRLRTLRARLKCNRRRPERDVLAPSPAAALAEERAARIERREQRVDVHCSGIVGRRSYVISQYACDVWRVVLGCGQWGGVALM